MAENIPDYKHTQLEYITNEINEAFDTLLNQLNKRRQILLDELKEQFEEITAKRYARDKKFDELNITKINIEKQLTHNELKEAYDRLLNEINQQFLKLDESIEEEYLECEFSTERLKAEISCFGSIFKKSGKIPNYSNMKKPSVAVIHKGKKNGELINPYGVAFSEERKEIFIADQGFYDCPEGGYTGSKSYLHIFSENGSYIRRIGEETLKFPWGVAVHKNTLYVTDICLNSIIMFRLHDCKLMKKVSNCGKDKFDNPNQIVISPNGDAYITDNNNHRIVVLDENLKSKYQISHATINHPRDINIYSKSLFILCDMTDLIIHVFTLKGDFLYSLLPRGEVKKPWFFSIDIRGNIIISDMNQHNVKIFNKKGKLTEIIGQKGHNIGDFYIPTGVTTAKSGKLIIVSNNNNFRLQIFD